MRLTSASLMQASTNTHLFQTQPAYDAANNAMSVASSIAGATDTQQFCYDHLNRLTWAGTDGTLAAARYQQSESYNLDGGLTGQQLSYDAEGRLGAGNCQDVREITALQERAQAGSAAVDGRDQRRPG